MALQLSDPVPVKWKLGDECELFIRTEFKWAKGEIIGSNKQGDRIKVRCGDQIHEVLAVDPDLRVRKENQRTFPIEAFQRFQRLTIEQSPNMASLLQNVLTLPANSDLQRALHPNNDSFV